METENPSTRCCIDSEYLAPPFFPFLVKQKIIGIYIFSPSVHCSTSSTMQNFGNCQCTYKEYCYASCSWDTQLSVSCILCTRKRRSQQKWKPRSTTRCITLNALLFHFTLFNTKIIEFFTFIPSIHCSSFRTWRLPFFDNCTGVMFDCCKNSRRGLTIAPTARRSSTAVFPTHDSP